MDHVLAARSAAATGDRVAALTSLEQARRLLEPASRTAPADLAFVLNEMAVLLRADGQRSAALAAADRAVDLAQGAPSLLAAALVNKGLAEQDLHRLADAVASFLTAEGLAARSGQAGLQRMALAARGAAALQGGDFGGADAALAAALVAEEAAGAGPARLAELRLQRAKAALAARTPAAAATQLAALPAADGLPLPLRLEARLLGARVALQQARNTEAEEALTALLGQTAGDWPDLHASVLYNLAELAFAAGRYVDANSLNIRAEAVWQDILPADHPVFGQIRHRQALILQELGDEARAIDRYADAERHLLRALGPDHPAVSQTRAERARALVRAGRAAEAVALARSVAQPPQAEAGTAQEALARAAVGLALFESGDPAAARPWLEAALAPQRNGPGMSIVDHPPGLLALAGIHLAAGNAGAAADLAARARDILIAMRADQVDTLGEARRIEAAAALATGDRPRALRLVRQNLATARAQLIALARASGHPTGLLPRNLRRQMDQALDLLWQEMQPDGGGDRISPAFDDPLAEEFFQAMQLLHLTETTRATLGLLRGLPPEIADLLARLQANSQELRQLGEQLADGQGTPEMTARAAALTGTEAELNAQIAALAPDQAGLLAPAPETLDAARAVLAPGSGLWLHSVTEGAGFMLLLTPDALHIARSPLGATELDHAVRALRRTLDQGGAEGLVPFDFAVAARLYAGLFGAFDAEIAALGRLVLLPDGAAQQIGLGVLVRGIDPTGDRADHRFLGLSHALSVTPSVTSFVRRGALAGGNPAEGDFFGFADPVLGPGLGLPPGARGGSPIDPLTGVARAGALASIFEPLPETAEEVTRMAAFVPPVQRRLFLGPEFTETRLRGLNLDGAGTLVFATHAIVAGEFGFNHEPALILTPPASPGPADDGLLTAGEIARMRIAAELVILSACNTASDSGRSGAAGLSGLALGFFQAGTRTVVASHWTILSVSSVLLMPPFFEAISGAEQVPPDEAMRRAMVAVATRGDHPGFAHPAVWAPFSVIHGG